MELEEKIIQFYLTTNKVPIQDDAERMFCLEAGESGHYFCGFCLEHWKPRFMCGCIFIKNYDQTIQIEDNSPR